MCSERRRLGAGLAALLVSALPLLAACGKKGDPRPRPRNVPQPASDLTVRQRGDRVLLAFAYPAATVAGLPLEGLESAAVYEIVQPLAPGATAPRFGGADFQAVGRPVRELTGRELTDAVVGDRILTEIQLPPGAVGAEEIRAYAVRTTALRGEPSPWSNTVALRTIEPPPAPADLAVTPRKEGVDLSWTPVTGGLGSVVLRREASEPRWSAPLATTPAEVGWLLDRGALYGTRYVYTVLTLGAESPPVESAPRIEREVDYRDVFAPEPPTGLRGLVAAGQVRLIWDASPDTDVAGYLVERSVAGGPFATLTETPVDALEYADGATPAGGPELAYRVIAVDRAGNRAEPTASIALRAP